MKILLHVLVNIAGFLKCAFNLAPLGGSNALVTEGWHCNQGLVGLYQGWRHCTINLTCCQLVHQLFSETEVHIGCQKLWSGNRGTICMSSILLLDRDLTILLQQRSAFGGYVHEIILYISTCLSIHVPLDRLICSFIYPRACLGTSSLVYSIFLSV